VHWEQAAMIEALRAEGRGIVFLTPHLGCFEVTARSYASQFGPVTGALPAGAQALAAGPGRHLAQPAQHDRRATTLSGVRRCCGP
jgi:KDO2-lipid IV(A) lauroyltransferase